MRRILVGVDGSAESRRAAHLAAKMAGGRELIFAGVVPALKNAGPFRDEYAVWRGELLQQRSDELTEIAAHERRSNTSVETRLLEGDDAAAALARAAREDELVEVVVVGHRARSGLVRAFFGSVADELVQRCEKPVLVVH